MAECKRCGFLCRCFFFKQKTAYEIMPSLVGSEMCIRDRCDMVLPLLRWSPKTLANTHTPSRVSASRKAAGDGRPRDRGGGGLAIRRATRPALSRSRRRKVAYQ